MRNIEYDTRRVLAVPSNVLGMVMDPVGCALDFEDTTSCSSEIGVALHAASSGD